MRLVRIALLSLAATATTVGVIDPVVAQEAQEVSAPAPTLALSSSSGPAGTEVVVSGEVPADVDCPFVQVTAARPAGGAAAAMLPAVPVSGGRYEAALEMPRIELPTEPPSSASEAVVRAWCVSSDDPDSSGTSDMAQAIFTYTDGGVASEVPTEAPTEVPAEPTEAEDGAAPTLALSPSSGPSGTRVTMSGEAPEGVDCPFVEVTATRGAGGAAFVKVAAPVTGGRYETTAEMPAITVPTVPPSLLGEATVRAFCVVSDDPESSSTSDASQAIFTYTDGGTVVPYEGPAEEPTEVIAAPGEGEEEAAPTLALSPSSGPAGTRVTMSGEVPEGVDCPFVHLTAARPAGGAAFVNRTVAVAGEGYETTVEMPAIRVPTDPPSLLREATVRATCVDADGPESSGTSGTARATFTYTGAGGGGYELPRTGADTSALALAGGGVTILGAGLLLLARRRAALSGAGERPPES